MVRLIGVAFDGMGRNPGQAGAPAALREAGLEAAFARREIVRRPDITVPAPRAARDPDTGFLNSAALLAMIQALREELSEALSAGQFPFVYGADCSVLLAAMPMLRAAAGEAGLLFVDGHEDATTMELSPDGEAANMEIAILLGMTGDRSPSPVSSAFGILKRDALAMLGPHDDAFRRPLGIGSIARLVPPLTIDEVHADPIRTTRGAVESISSRAPNWWLHTDLDVLDHEEFPAHGSPTDARLTRGLTWQDLTAVVRTALSARDCRGWSLVIYNPDLDADRTHARRIVQFVIDVAPYLAGKETR